jgi:L-fuconolactonase
MVTEAKWNIWKVDDFAPYVDHIIESFSPDRLMFGSDWPVALLAAASYSDVVHLAQGLTTQFTARENELFWRDNALSAYKITKL